MKYYLGRTNNRAPRSARRARKPLRENWIKGPGQATWIRCTYAKCSFEWRYFGKRRWAECPICHSVMKIAVAKRNFLNQNKARLRSQTELTNNIGRRRSSSRRRDRGNRARFSN
jgi:hypothetical protein